MKAVYSLLIYLLLIGLVIIGVSGAGLDYLFAVVIPYCAIALFLVGFVYRIIKITARL